MDRSYFVAGDVFLVCCPVPAPQSLQEGAMSHTRCREAVPGFDPQMKHHLYEKNCYSGRNDVFRLKSEVATPISCTNGAGITQILWASSSFSSCPLSNHLRPAEPGAYWMRSGVQSLKRRL